MFSQPVSSPPVGLTQTTSTVSPPRSSRLRGLSYLRNYTHSHLLSRDASHQTVPSPSPPAPASGRTNAATPSTSATLSASSAASAVQNPNRLTLIPNMTSADPSRPSQPHPSPAHNVNNTGSVLEPVVNESLVSRGPIRSKSATEPRTSALPSSTTVAAMANASVASSASPSASASASAVSAALDPSTAAAASIAPRFFIPPDPILPDPSAPSIRFCAYFDPRSTRPSLTFSPLSRILPTGTEIIRVGRYSDRDGQAAFLAASQPSAAPVGFKSKVVSRRHCEFWQEKGKWYIKDVKSSSGTFLNHIRLSPPSQESKAYPINDGDIVQLGIDFKGGEEMIFRCVKMRLELNRGWQNKPNIFNVAAHKRLQTMANSTRTSTTTNSNSNSQDCSICLNSIAPCQSLFVAPCSHTWHFKCVRLLLTSPQYPIFICPNCRAGADLEAEVEETSEEWEQLDDSQEEEAGKGASADNETRPETSADMADTTVQDTDDMDTSPSASASASASTSEISGRLSSPSHAASEPLPIVRKSFSSAGRSGNLMENRSPSPPVNGEGPITPRNNAGPWVFDGSAGQRAAVANSAMRSLDAATESDVNPPTTSDDSSS